MAAQEVEVLVDRVGGALVPVRGDALLGRQQLDELVEAAVEEGPAALHVADQALRLVLRADADAPDAGIDAVRQREIDDAELAAERHRRLGAPVGQRPQPPAAAAGEDHRERVVREPRAGRAGSLVLVHEMAVTRTVLGRSWCRSGRRSDRLLCPDHQPELERMREQRVAGISANPAVELAAHVGREVERVAHGAVGVRRSRRESAESAARRRRRRHARFPEQARR